METKQGFVFRGEWYPDMKTFCAMFGITYNTVFTYRKRKRCSTEEAIAHCLEAGPKNTKFVYRGQTYPSVKDCCVAVGVPYNAVKARCCRTGCTAEDAIDYYLEQGYKPRRGFFYNGQIYPSRTACCESQGISYSSVNDYCHSTGCTWEEAITHFRLPFKLKPLYTGRTTGKTYYSGTCRTCKRKLLLAEEEIEGFVHSDEFCENHVIPWEEDILC